MIKVNFLFIIFTLVQVNRTSRLLSSKALNSWFFDGFEPPKFRSVISKFSRLLVGYEFSKFY